MMRTMLGVGAGYAVWTVLWLGGNAVLFGSAQAPPNTHQLAGLIVLSLVCSLAAGLAAAAVAKARANMAVWVMAALLLLTGIGVQISAWAQMPVWYHATFLVLIVPACVVGGRLLRRRPG